MAKGVIRSRGSNWYAATLSRNAPGAVIFVMAERAKTSPSRRRDTRVNGVRARVHAVTRLFGLPLFKSLTVLVLSAVMPW